MNRQIHEAGSRICRMIVLDLDGTLLNENKEISPAGRQTLQRALARGIHIVIASGRPFTALPQEIRSFEGIEYAITSNGSSIFHLRRQERIYGRELNPDSVRSLLPLIRRGDIPCEAASGGSCYTMQAYYQDPAAFGLPARIRSYVQSTRIPVADMPAFIEAHLTTLEGVYLLLPDPARMKAVRQQVSRIPGLYLTSSTPYYLEIADQSVSKALALDWLCRLLDIERESVIAFGDSANDEELLEYAGTGIAMANAQEELKNKADAVTLSNEEDGVAWYLQNYIL